MSADLKQAALGAFRMLIDPIVSLMLRCGVTWKELSELLRLSYVDVASREYGKHGRRANVSRVAILTDMSRRDVRRARELLARDSGAALDALQRMSRATRVLSAWFLDPDYLDARGRPRLLEVEGQDGFEGLLRRHAPDLPPTAMLKELKSVGAVRQTPTGRVRPIARTFIPAPLDPDGVIRAGEVVGDLAHDIAENLKDAGSRARFERRAMSRRVARKARRAFDRHLELKAMEFLENMDEWLIDHETDDADERMIRLGVGVYLITED
jgi:Family of unknown function (DUF6502)